MILQHKKRLIVFTQAVVDFAAEMEAWLREQANNGYCVWDVPAKKSLMDSTTAEGMNQRCSYDESF